MQVITKHYLEMYFPIYSDNEEDEIKSYKIIVRTDSERKPLLIGDATFSHVLVTHFRYFDMTEVILDDGETICGQRKNYSPMYYCGKRLNKTDIKKLGEFYENFCKEQEIDSIIECYNGGLILNPEEESITIEELKEKRKEKIKVLRYIMIR